MERTATDTLGYSNTEPTRLKSVTVNVPAGDSKSGYVDMDYISYSSKYFMIAIQNDTENTSSSIPVLFYGSANSIVSLPSELKDYGVDWSTHGMNGTAYRLYTIFNPASGWARNKCFNEFSSQTDTSLAVYIKGETVD